MHRTDQV
jgi:alpha-1,3-glucan synthase